MRYFFWFARIAILLAAGLFLHYYLPSYDVVRIVDADVKRMDRGRIVTDGATPGAGMRTRDVSLIQTLEPDGSPRVYRNEDTGWSFPWYFKFDSENIQATAKDLRSTAAEPHWVVVKHYGWRIELFSLFPNTISIDAASGPDQRIIPWFRIVFFTLLVVGLLLLWRAWHLFLQRRWIPFLERLALDERFDNASNSAAQVWRWFKANRRDKREGKSG
jgi:hypothetical protein